MPFTYQSPNAIGTNIGNQITVPNAIVATGLDTTSPVGSRPIGTFSGDIVAFAAQAVVTGQTGTSPTVNLILQGSNDGTNFFTLTDTSGNPIQSGATSISTATTGTPVVIGVDTERFSRFLFSTPYIRAQVVLGGTSAGANYTVSISVLRNKTVR